MSRGPTNQTKPLGKARLLAWAIVAASFASPTLAGPEVREGQSADKVNFPLKARQLGDALKEIAVRSGIEFRLADDLRLEKVTATLIGKDWSEACQPLLKGYNYAVEFGGNGMWKTVTISGKNGDGKTLTATTAKYQTYSRPRQPGLPPRLQGLNPGSVTPITLPLATLKGMKLGKSIALELPHGQRSFVHDNRFHHANGDITWVGYAEGEGQPSRAMISMGRYGPMGHIVTTEGDFQIVTEAGQSYLVDVNASGLQPGSLLEDQAMATAGNADGLGGEPAQPGFGGGGTAKRYSASAVTTAAGMSATPATAEANAPNLANFSTIDVLALYTKGLAQPDSRINYLADLTNQAYLDSKVNARIRVVKLEQVDYGDTGDNALALSDLTSGTSPFDKIQALREKYGADLVTLIRPFHAGSQNACGIAWVNGSEGTAPSPSLGYSVVSDGYDRDGRPVYCGGHTLAHELGHNLGNVHDRPFTTASGAFPYSYAWGVEGDFGTIMSYRHPTVLLFATPLLAAACHGQPCGYPEGDPNASDNTSTINQTAPIVAGFLPTAAAKP